ncbi:hypothetical protein FS837_012718 [Tulasnella sp. UAMH 9824]|nr:hypothetical protein FS837_012718 [Tulasnella sp. UAMH 9824]
MPTDGYVFCLFEVCKGLLEDYRDLAGDEAKVFVNALGQAAQTAYALPEPDPEKTEFHEAFHIRTVYDDPNVKKLVTSEMITPKKRLELERVSEEILQQQPMFPPECYAILRG